ENTTINASATPISTRSYDTRPWFSAGSLAPARNKAGAAARTSNATNEMYGYFQAMEEIMRNAAGCSRPAFRRPTTRSTSRDDALSRRRHGFFGVLYSASFWNGFQSVS